MSSKYSTKATKIVTNKKCSYGCNNTANYIFKNNRLCCKKHHQSCPTRIAMLIGKKRPNHSKWMKLNNPRKNKQFVSNNNILKIIKLYKNANNNIKSIANKLDASKYLVTKVLIQNNVEIRSGQLGKNAPNYRKRLSKEWRKKISDSCTPGLRGKDNFCFGKKYTEKEKKHLSKKSKEWWNNLSEKEREKWFKKVEAGLKNRPTSLEKKFHEILDKTFPNQWNYVGDGSLWLNRANPDFIHKDKNIIIEVFVIYFKEKMYGSVKNYKKVRKKIFDKIKFKVLFFTKEEIDNNLNKVLKKIKDCT